MEPINLSGALSQVTPFSPMNQQEQRVDHRIAPQLNKMTTYMQWGSAELQTVIAGSVGTEIPNFF